jgi:hypothetical protein
MCLCLVPHLAVQGQMKTFQNMRSGDFQQVLKSCRESTV